MSAAEGLSRRTLIGAGLAGGIAAAFPALAHDPAMPLCHGPVDSPDGRYEARSCAGAWSYPLIRYARAERFQPPVALRSAEQLAGKWSDIPACPQPSDNYSPEVEDCLFLNVWTPRTTGDARPVMVYFHGGAYSNGSVGDSVNEGARLAERGDLVVVTVNHRLNALGYLYLPERFPDSGNNGQLDLVCALQWIQRNIAAFGGDPGNVTVFGQSGGGAKIATLMAMPAAAGLFHKAITMSGQQVTASGPLNAAKRTKVFLEALGQGIDPATVPVEQLIAAMSATDPVLGGGLYMGPVVDMRNLKRHPFWPDAAPQSNHIPMLLGNTVMETRAFYSAERPPIAGLTMANLAERIAPQMRVDIEPNWVVAQFRARYPDAPAFELFHRIVTAARSWRGQVEEAEARASAGSPAAERTWVYQLDFEQAKHTDDIALSFGTVSAPTPAQQAISDTVMDAFVRFARTGDPGWPTYDLAHRQTMVFDTVSRVESNPRSWERELFARVPYIQPGS